MNVKEQLKRIKKEISEKREKLTAMSAEVRDLVKTAEGDGAEEKLAEAKEKRKAYSDLEAEIRNLESTRDLYKSVIDGNSKKVETKRDNEPQSRETREAINAYLHSRGAVRDNVPFEKTEDGSFVVLKRDGVDPSTDGIKAQDVKPIIPYDISYTPVREIQTVVDLSQYVQNKPVKTASGEYPVLKNVADRMHTVAELEKSPKMSKPNFAKVEWRVDTYREAIPVAQEDIDDSAVDLMGILTENANQLKVNTSNYAIASALKGFTAKTIANIDDLKRINNVSLDPAYSRSLLVSQSFYNWLDTLKDGNGRYLLQDSILTPSGKIVLGMPIVVVSDTTFGADGDAKAFIGDLKRAVFYAKRADLMVRWVEDVIYGQYLQAAMRFGVAVADAKAGYFLTVDEGSNGGGAPITPKTAKTAKTAKK